MNMNQYLISILDKDSPTVNTFLLHFGLDFLIEEEVKKESEERGEGDWEHCQILVQEICAIKPNHQLIGIGFHQSSRPGAWENGQSIFPTCLQNQLVCVRVCVRLCYESKDQRKPKQTIQLLSLFHVLHSPFSLTTGRNLPPADTQIGTDAKAPPWTALTRSFL